MYVFIYFCMIDHDVLYCNCFVIHWADCHLYNYYVSL